MMPRRARVFGGAVVALVGLAAGAPPAPAADATLIAVVGPEYTITLSRPDGSPVRRLDPGRYRVEVEDLSENHNFRLEGPDVDIATRVERFENVVWTLDLREGRYVFFCDPHERMRGDFVVGNPTDPPPSPSPPPSNPPSRSPSPVLPGLNATVGPGFRIALTRSGRRVTTIAAGSYALTLRDRSTRHNLHVRGPGVERRTTVAGTGSARRSATLRPGIYRFFCDPHPSRLSIRLRVSARE